MLACVMSFIGPDQQDVVGMIVRHLEPNAPRPMNRPSDVTKGGGFRQRLHDAEAIRALRRLESSEPSS